LAYPKAADFDDALFEALGLPLQENGVNLVPATLPATPAPPLAVIAVSNGENVRKLCLSLLIKLAAAAAPSCQLRQRV